MRHIGELIRYWRDQRGLTQSQVADRCDLSNRHLSFIETGRASPSRETALILARVLEIPNLERSRMLILAGHAEDWLVPAEDIDRREWWLTSLEGALQANEPFPAWITDHQWKIVRSNRALDRLLMRCCELNPDLKPGDLDVTRIFCDANSLQKIVRNWDRVVENVIAGLFRLQPDPAASPWTAPLYRSVAANTHHRPESMKPDGTRSDVLFDFDDQGHRFSLHVNAMPLCGRCSGFVLGLMSPSNSESQEAAVRYFDGLEPRP